MGIPLSVICCFSLEAFNIHCLCLIFISLINMCLIHLPSPRHCFLGAPQGHSPRCTVCLLWGADLRL